LLDVTTSYIIEASISCYLVKYRIPSQILFNNLRQSMLKCWFLLSRCLVLVYNYLKHYFSSRPQLFGKWRNPRWQCSGPWAICLQVVCGCSYNLLRPIAFFLNILLHLRIDLQLSNILENWSCPRCSIHHIFLVF